MKLNIKKIITVDINRPTNFKRINASEIAKKEIKICNMHVILRKTDLIKMGCKIYK